MNIIDLICMFYYLLFSTFGCLFIYLFYHTRVFIYCIILYICLYGCVKNKGNIYTFPVSFKLLLIINDIVRYIHYQFIVNLFILCVFCFILFCLFAFLFYYYYYYYYISLSFYYYTQKIVSTSLTIIQFKNK